MLLVITSTQLLGQDTLFIKNLNKLEFLLDKQISSADELKKEEKKLIDRIDKLIEIYDSVSIQNLVKYEKLENNIFSNTTNIDSIKNKKPEKKQNSWTDWIKAIAAIFTTFIAVPAAVFSIRNYYYQKIKRLEDLEGYFKVIIDALDEPLQKQAVLLSKFSKSITEKRLSNQVLGRISELRIDNVENIDQVDLYKIFVSIRKGDRMIKLKEFLRLCKALSFIKDYINFMPKFYDEFNKKRIETHNFWNENITKIGAFYDKYLIVNSVNTSQIVDDPFMKRFRELKLNWQSLTNEDGSNNDPYFVLKHFIDPLYNFCQEDTDPEKILELMPWIVNCKTAIFDFDSLKNTYSSFAEKDCDSLESIRNHLKDSMNILFKIKKINKWNLLFS